MSSAAFLQDVIHYELRPNVFSFCFFNRSRKLNSQLEKAIQEAMIELDRMSSTPSESIVASPVELKPKSITISSSESPKVLRPRETRTTTAQQRNKLIKIAPAPPNNSRKNSILAAPEKSRWTIVEIRIFWVVYVCT